MEVAVIVTLAAVGFVGMVWAALIDDQVQAGGWETFEDSDTVIFQTVWG